MCVCVFIALSEVEKAAEVAALEEQPRLSVIVTPEMETGVAPPTHDRQISADSQQDEEQHRRHRDSASTLNHSSSFTGGTVSMEQSLELHEVSLRSGGSIGGTTEAVAGSDLAEEKENGASGRNEDEEFRSLSPVGPSFASLDSTLTPSLPGLSLPAEDGGER